MVDGFLSLSQVNVHDTRESIQLLMVVRDVKVRVLENTPMATFKRLKGNACSRKGLRKQFAASPSLT